MSTPIENNTTSLESILAVVNDLPRGAADAVLYTAQNLTEEQKAQARENIGLANADCVIPQDVRLAIYRLLSSAVTTEENQSEHIDLLYEWAGRPDEPTAELLDFDLVNGNITVKNTFIRFWSNFDGSQPSRMEMNPALIRHDSGYQYTAKLASGDYYMHPNWLSFDNTTATFEVDETVAMTTWNGTAALIGEKSFYGGGELIIPECDVFFVHLGRRDKAELTDEDKEWLRNNFTVERVRV